MTQYLGITRIGRSVNGEPGADGYQPNLYGYDSKLTAVKGIASIAHTKTGFAFKGNNSNPWEVKVSGMQGGGTKYAVSFDILSDISGEVTVKIGTVTTTMSKTVTAYVSKKVELKVNYGEDPYVTISFNTATNGIVKINNFKVEEASTLNGTCTAFTGLADDETPQGQNIFVHTNDYREQWSNVGETNNPFNSKIDTDNVLNTIPSVYYYGGKNMNEVNSPNSDSIDISSYANQAIVLKGAAYDISGNYTYSGSISKIGYHIDILDSSYSVIKSIEGVHSGNITIQLPANANYIRGCLRAGYHSYNGYLNYDIFYLDNYIGHTLKMKQTQKSAGYIMKQATTNRLKPNTWYTLSWYDRCTSTEIYDEQDNKIENKYYLNINNPIDQNFIVVEGEARLYTSYDNVNVIFKPAKGWTRHSITFRTKSQFDESDYIMWWYNKNENVKIADSQGMLYNFDVFIACPMLESGEKPTSWSESANDRKGASIRISEWEQGKKYYCGNDGEDFIDIVTCPDYNTSELFLCKVTHTATNSNKPSADTIKTQEWSETAPWCHSEISQFVATKLLLAERGYINNLALNNAIAAPVTSNGAIDESNATVKIDGATGKMIANSFATGENGKRRVEVADSLLEIFNSSGKCNIKFGIVGGYAVLSYYDNNGTKLYDLGPNGILSEFSSNGATYSQRKYKRIGNITDNIGSQFAGVSSLDTYYIWTQGYKAITSGDGKWKYTAYEQTGQANDWQDSAFANNNKLVKSNTSKTSQPTDVAEDGLYAIGITEKYGVSRNIYVTPVIVVSNGYPNEGTDMFIYTNALTNGNFVDKNGNSVSASTYSEYFNKTGQIDKYASKASYTKEIGDTTPVTGTITMKDGSTVSVEQSQQKFQTQQGTWTFTPDSNEEGINNAIIKVTDNDGNTTETDITIEYLPYLYQGEFSPTAMPAIMSATFIKNHCNKTLCNDRYKSATKLSAGKVYVFACKGDISFKLYSVNPSVTINGFTTGKVTIDRVNGNGNDEYSYIIVPSSNIDWTFEIRN